jgi:hypothetical protein
LPSGTLAHRGDAVIRDAGRPQRGRDDFVQVLVGARERDEARRVVVHAPDVSRALDARQLAQQRCGVDAGLRAGALECADDGQRLAGLVGDDRVVVLDGEARHGAQRARRVLPRLDLCDRQLALADFYELAGDSVDAGELGVGPDGYGVGGLNVPTGGGTSLRWCTFSSVSG